MLSLDLVTRKLDAPSPGLPASDPRLPRISRLADEGDYAAAAAGAAAVFSDGIHDVRLSGYYLDGVFLERGVAALPEILDAVAELVAERLPSMGPADRRARFADVALVWLFRTMLDQIEFHERQGDARWHAWIAGRTPDLLSRALGAADRARAAAQAVLEEPRCLEHLSRLERWMRGKLGAPAPAHAAPASRAAIDLSPAVQSILHKLQAFEALVQRGDAAGAVAVSGDVRRAIEDFLRRA